MNYIDSPEFHDPANIAAILEPMPGEAEWLAAKDSCRVPKGAGDYAELYRWPLLDREQERHLFRQMNYLKSRGEDCTVARDRIINCNLRLCASVGKKWAKWCGSMEEAVSVCQMALVRCVDKFDYSRGFKFSTYCTWGMANNLKRSRKESQGRNPSEDLRVHGPLEIEDRPVLPFGPSEEMLSDLRDCLAELSPRELGIMVMRHYGGKSLKECGEELGVTKERIRQIQQAAIWKMQSFAGIDPPKKKTTLARYRDAVSPRLFEDAA